MREVEGEVGVVVVSVAAFSDLRCFGGFLA